MKNRQHFELLSAYLDRELPPKEEEKVEAWLINDPEAQKTYKNLLKIRYRLRQLPAPWSKPSSQVLSREVITKAENYQFMELLFWGGGTIVALLITIMSGVLSWNSSPSDRFADAEVKSSEALMISINQPIVEKPIVPVSSPSSDQ